MTRLGQLYTVRILHPNPHADYTLTVRAPNRGAVAWAAADAKRSRGDVMGTLDLSTILKLKES
jgi:hypothetical protein